VAQLSTLGGIARHKMLKIFLQSLLGLLVVIATFVAGLFLSTFVPGAGGKYMSPVGEFMVAALIFITTLTLGILARFKPSVLFLTLGFTALFEVSVLLLLSGRCSDMEEIWNHTLLPVAISAVVLLFIRRYYDHRNAA
jgi:hypothetical protein